MKREAKKKNSFPTKYDIKSPPYEVEHSQTIFFLMKLEILLLCCAIKA